MKNIYALLFTFLSGLLFSQVIKVETLSTGLLYPVGIHNTGIPNDNRIFVLEKRGRIKIMDRSTGAVKPVPFLDIYNKVYPVTTAGDERGLLGLAFHPDYASNGYFYVNYITPAGKTVIARYQVSAFPDTAMVVSEQILLSISQPFTNHKGGNLMFGPLDGYLYASLGDGGSGGDPGNRAQNIDTLLGKTLRIDVNNPAPPYYFSAPGNPFYGPTAGRDEIFDWGLRNHWRCSFDRMTGDMWTADVGQSAVEEINFRPRCDVTGHNYGWRCYEGSTAYSTGGCQPQSTYEAPIYVYGHSLGCSVTGGYVYRGGHEGGLFGKYLFTDYCQGRIWALSPNGNGGWSSAQLTQSTAQINNNYSSWGEDVYGELYLAGVNSGNIYRVRDTACAPVAYIDAPDTLLICSGNPVKLKTIHSPGLTYNWTLNSAGSWSISSGQGTDQITAAPDVNSSASIVVTVSNGTCSAVSNTVVVIAGATLDGLEPFYCIQYTEPVDLVLAPGGGTLSGPGVAGNLFVPAIAGSGTHTLTYTVADTISTCYYEASGCIFSASKVYTVAICGGIEEQGQLRDIQVYPNPGSSEFHLEWLSLAQTSVDLKLRDALGREVYSSSAAARSGKQELLLLFPDLGAGVYFLSVVTEKDRVVKKIMIER